MSLRKEGSESGDKGREGERYGADENPVGGAVVKKEKECQRKKRDWKKRESDDEPHFRTTNRRALRLFPSRWRVGRRSREGGNPEVLIERETSERRGREQGQSPGLSLSSLTSDLGAVIRARHIARSTRERPLAPLSFLPLIPFDLLVQPSGSVHLVRRSSSSSRYYHPNDESEAYLRCSYTQTSSSTNSTSSSVPLSPSLSCALVGIAVIKSTSCGSRCTSCCMYSWTAKDESKEEKRGRGEKGSKERASCVCREGQRAGERERWKRAYLFPRTRSQSPFARRRRRSAGGVREGRGGRREGEEALGCRS
jgi:hypothetical protein